MEAGEQRRGCGLFFAARDCGDRLMAEKTDSRRSLGMFITSMLIFGTVGVLRRYIPLPSALLAFARGILGGLFLLVFVRASRKGAREKLPARTFLLLVATGAMIGINWILLFEAYNHTTVAVATLCYYMEPTIVMLLSPIIFRERLTGRKAVCAAVSILGMVLVSGVIGDSGGQGGNLRGILLGLGAAFFYSGVVIMNKTIPGIDAYRSRRGEFVLLFMSFFEKSWRLLHFNTSNLSPHGLQIFFPWSRYRWIK